MDSPTTKRTRESLPETSQNIDKLKHPRLTMDSPFRAMQSLENRFEKLTAKLTNTIKETVKNEIRECECNIIEKLNNRMSEIETKLLSEINSLKSEFEILNDRISVVEAQCSEITELRKEMDCLKSDMYVMRNKISKQENSMVSDELRITGIPYIPNEDLMLHFNNLCGALQIQGPRCRSIFRVGGIKHKAVHPDSSIIMKMDTPYDKNYVLKCINNYKKNNKCNLKLNIIGFDSDVNFFVNENLTATNYNIFKTALKCRKMDKISSVFTLRGIVHIRINAGDEPVCVNSIDELNNLFR